MDTLEDSADGGLADADALARRVRLSIEQGRLTGLRLTDVEVIGGTVVLSGKAATYHQKQLASALAGGVAGVVEVMNRLEVHYGGNDDNSQQPIRFYRPRRADGKANRKSD